MIDQFVTLCLKRRQVAWLIAILMAIFGYSSWKALKIEAYPDIADVSSQVITQYPGHAAEEVEEQVTVPLERELNGIPGLQIMRSHSTFGLSLITLVFQDGVDDPGEEPLPSMRSLLDRRFVGDCYVLVQLPGW